MSKHTPGHWQTSIGHDARGYPFFYIHGMSGEQKRDVETLNANAKLIAVAPELLALLQELIDIEGPQPGHVMWASKVKAALAKATA